MKKAVSGLIILIVAIFFLSPVSFIAIQGNSMDPTIPDNALLLTYETNDVQQNDIVTFYSNQTNGYVTHRIVEKNPNGSFITLGDNNAVPDQEIGIEPLQPQNVDSKAIMFQGEAVYIPYLGLAILLIQQNLLALATIGFILITIFSSIREKFKSNRLYSQLIAKDVFHPIFIVTVILLILLFVINATILTVPFVYTANEETAGQQYVVQTNVQDPIETIQINSSDSWYTHELYLVSGFEPIEIERSSTKTNITAQLPTQDRPGSYETQVSVYTIPAILPQTTAQQLAYISPIIPITLSSLIILSPFYILYYFYIGPKTPIRNPKISRIVKRFG